MIPEKIIKNNQKFKFIKEYDDFILYENTKTGVKECFSYFQIGMLKEIEKPARQLKEK